MKKTIITLSLVISGSILFAQVRDTTKQIPFHQNELGVVQYHLQQIYQNVHKTNLPALRRDSIDQSINLIYQLIERRAASILDTTKKQKGKKP